MSHGGQIIPLSAPCFATLFHAADISRVNPPVFQNINKQLPLKGQVLFLSHPGNLLSMSASMVDAVHSFGKTQGARDLTSRNYQT
jgi:hypothetical protein